MNNATATLLKSKDQILATKGYHKEYPNYISENQVEEAMDEYAESNSIEFTKWRSFASSNMQHRYKLNLPLPEQYQLFLKENGLT